MSSGNSPQNIGKIFEQLREMEVTDGEELREYANTFNSIMAKIHLEVALMSEEVKTLLKTMPTNKIEMSKKELFVRARWTAHYMKGAADEIESAQRSANKCVKSFEKHFSDDAIAQRKADRQERERKAREKAHKNRRR